MWLKILGALLLPVLGYILFLVLCSLFVSPKREYETHSAFYRALLNGATAAALWLLRVRVHTVGTERIPTEGTKPLFVCNHRSKFDPIVTWYVLRKWQIAFISKPENFKVPVFGRIIRKCCFMAIDRDDPRNAIGTIRKAGKLLEKGEVSVGVYPEGTRSADCRLLPFHNGVFKIAQRAHAPLVVLTVSGTEAVRKNFPLRRTDIYLNVADVLPADGVANTRTEVLGEKIRGEMLQSLNQYV